MIKAENITVEIHEKKLLDAASLELRCGEILAVVGANGAGKSTLRKVLCGDLLPTSGKVSMNGKLLAEWTLSERAEVRAILPQDSTLNFPFTVLEVVLLGRAPHIKGAESANDYCIAGDALKAVKSTHLTERLYTTLSGGERQRVQLARVLAQIWEKTDKPRYLILDEPTSNLDLAHQHQTLQIAEKFARENAGVLVILHDLNLAAQYSDKILMLKNGKITAYGTPEKVLNETAIAETFDVEVSVIPHPHFDCPLIVWKNGTRI